MYDYLSKLQGVNESIISSGKEYFKEGRVHNLHKEDGVYSATVSGSKDYSVSVSFNGDGTLNGFSCDCPYPRLCKHVVATMMAAEEDGKDGVLSNLKTLISSRGYQSKESLLGLLNNVSAHMTLMDENSKIKAIALYVSFLFNNYDASKDDLITVIDKLVMKNLSNEQFKIDVIVEILSSLDDNKTYECFWMLFGIEWLSSSVEKAFSKLDEGYKKKVLSYCSSGNKTFKDLNNVLYVANTKERVLSLSSLRFAKVSFECNGDGDGLATILKAFQNRGLADEIETEDIRTLKELSFAGDAKKLALWTFKSTDRLSIYVLLHELYPGSEFSVIASDIYPFLLYKPYLGAAMLIDRDKYFNGIRPKGEKEPTFEQLDALNGYLLPKDKEKYLKKAEQLVDKCVRSEKWDKQFPFAIDYLRKNLRKGLSNFVMDPFTEETLKENGFEGYWLSLADSFGLLEKDELIRYNGDNEDVFA